MYKRTTFRNDRPSAGTPSSMPPLAVISHFRRLRPYLLLLFRRSLSHAFSRFSPHRHVYQQTICSPKTRAITVRSTTHLHRSTSSRHPVSNYKYSISMPKLVFIWLRASRHDSLLRSAFSAQVLCMSVFSAYLLDAALCLHLRFAGKEPKYSVFLSTPTQPHERVALLKRHGNHDHKPRREAIGHG
jgi:hypothetical protein